MLQATRSGVLKRTYSISVDGSPVAVWDPSMWRSGGTFDLEGQHYTVSSNLWGGKYTMASADGSVFASAEHVGRKRWSVLSEGRAYEFQRASLWRSDQLLTSGGTSAGSVRRTSMWRSNATADLPGLSLPLQIFVVAVVLTIWERQQRASAGAAGGSGGTG